MAPCSKKFAVYGHDGCSGISTLDSYIIVQYLFIINIILFLFSFMKGIDTICMKSPGKCACSRQQ
jgi:uncharacterized membrane protein YtjA (UPF0391 family)